MGEETTKRFNGSRWQAIPKADVEREIAKMEDAESRRFWRNCLMTFAIGSVVFSMALWAVMAHYGKV